MKYLLTVIYSTSNRPVPHPEMVSTKVSNGSATRCAKLATTSTPLSTPQHLHRQGAGSAFAEAARAQRTLNLHTYDQLAIGGAGANFGGLQAMYSRHNPYSLQRPFCDEKQAETRSFVHWVKRMHTMGCLSFARRFLDPSRLVQEGRVDLISGSRG